ncbi:MAG: hypothetical protein NW201_14380 [Gemmatimonadales bacterium]|nr:hypothetical protein [Gemmatimonadales bacterium]
MRARQRGFRTGDVELIALLGRPVHDGIMLDDLAMRAAFERLRRLHGTFVAGGSVAVTVYRPSRKQMRKLRRRSR